MDEAKGEDETILQSPSEESTGKPLLPLTKPGAHPVSLTDPRYHLIGTIPPPENRRMKILELFSIMLQLL